MLFTKAGQPYPKFTHKIEKGRGVPKGGPHPAKGPLALMPIKNFFRAESRSSQTINMTGLVWLINVANHTYRDWLGIVAALKCVSKQRVV